MYTDKYGSDPSQEGDLFIPNEKPLAVLCLFHGGFWRIPYGREQLTPVARNLVQKDFIVWNVGYRRIDSGGGWPATFEDVVASINHIKHLCHKYKISDLNKVVLIGHSAGGQLAIWAAHQNNKSGHETLQIKPDMIVGLAPVTDLLKAFNEKLGDNSVYHLLKGSPDDRPERYASCDPMQMEPLNVPQLIIHGTDDDALPIQWSRDYVEASNKAGAGTEIIEIENGGHMDFIDPNSKAVSVMCEFLVNRYAQVNVK